MLLNLGGGAGSILHCVSAGLGALGSWSMIWEVLTHQLRGDFGNEFEEPRVDGCGEGG